MVKRDKVIFMDIIRGWGVGSRVGGKRGVGMEVPFGREGANLDFAGDMSRIL